jgi:hypothetical protein
MMLFEPHSQKDAKDGHDQEKHDSMKNLPTLPANLGDPSFGSLAEDFFCPLPSARIF